MQRVIFDHHIVFCDHLDALLYTMDDAPCSDHHSVICHHWSLQCVLTSLITTMFCQVCSSKYIVSSPTTSTCFTVSDHRHGFCHPWSPKCVLSLLFTNVYVIMSGHHHVICVIKCVVTPLCYVLCVVMSVTYIFAITSHQIEFWRMWIASNFIVSGNLHMFAISCGWHIFCHPWSWLCYYCSHYHAFCSLFIVCLENKPYRLITVPLHQHSLV